MAGSYTTEAAAAEAKTLSEIFHELSQPLTALHCTLELALEQDHAVDEMRASVESALADAERLRRRLLMLRAVKEADSPHQDAEFVDLGAVLRELRDDLAPIFEGARKGLVLDAPESSLLVYASLGRLKQALFTFVEYVFRYLADGAQLRIELNRSPHDLVEIHIESESCLPASLNDGSFGLPHSCEIELVRRTFRSAGGSFELLSFTSDRNIWSATLPRASSTS
jgi:signal transduction histidine kinase